MERCAAMVLLAFAVAATPKAYLLAVLPPMAVPRRVSRVQVRALGQLALARRGSRCRSRSLRGNCHRYNFLPIFHVLTNIAFGVPKSLAPNFLLTLASLSIPQQNFPLTARGLLFPALLKLRQLHDGLVEILSIHGAIHLVVSRDRPTTF